VVVLAVAVTVTVPLPEPLPPLAIDSQVALLVAVHAQPVATVTPTEPLPPVATMLCVDGDSATVHDTPNCVTVTVCPPTVTVALRDDVDVLAVAVTVTVPLPDPLPPLVIDSHVALLVAVHAQPVATVTVTVPLPPAATMFEPDDSATVHATPDCVTVTVCPATVTVALREDVDVLAAAVTVTVPLPEPVPPLPIVSHVALLVAVHAQPDATVTPTEPLPPAATMFCVDGESATEHATPDCVTVTDWPPAVTVALREADPVLAAAVTVTVPFPEPLAPVIESHVALSVAVHVQPVGAVIVTVPLAPPATMFCVAGESAKLQDTPAWVTVTAWPPTVTVALRAVLDVLAVAVSVTVPFPEPLAPAVTVNHAALLVAVHAQPEPAVSERVAVPPPTGTLVVSVDTENEHVVPYANESTDMALVPRPPGPTAATSAV
jgi:hypothetical protein